MFYYYTPRHFLRRHKWAPLPPSLSTIARKGGENQPSSSQQLESGDNVKRTPEKNKKRKSKEVKKQKMKVKKTKKIGEIILFLS